MANSLLYADNHRQEIHQGSFNSSKKQKPENFWNLNYTCRNPADNPFGSYYGDKYVWIKEEALTALNTSNFKHKSVKCTKVDISYDKYNVYYGLATLDNGQVQNIEVRYKTQNKGTGRYYYSIFDFYVKQVK